MAKPLTQLARSTRNAEKIREWYDERMESLEAVGDALDNAEAALEAGSGYDAEEKDDAWETLQAAMDDFEPGV